MAQAKRQDDERSERQAIAQLESIKEMVAALNATEVDGVRDDEVFEAAEQTIHEDPLSVEVRSGWHSPDMDRSHDIIKSAEYNILLATGGPACRIIGTLNEYGEPETAHIEHQDWGTPWTEYRITSDDEATVLQYVRCFYFGE